MNRIKQAILVGTAGFRLGAACVGTFGIGLAIFLSLKSSPSMTAVRWLPHFITAWANQHGRFCNFPAYGLLAIPFLAVARGQWHRAIVTASLAMLVAALEIAQLWIPTRFADKWDVFWGCSGLLTSWAFFEMFHLIFKKTPFHGGERLKPNQTRGGAASFHSGPNRLDEPVDVRRRINSDVHGRE